MVDYHHFCTGYLKFNGFAPILLRRCPVIQTDIRLIRLAQLAAGVIPAAHWPLPLLLAYVLADIGHSSGIFAVEPLRGGETEAPLREVVHLPPIPTDAGVNGLEAVSGKESMEMPGPVPVLLWHQDVT